MGSFEGSSTVDWAAYGTPWGKTMILGYNGPKEVYGVRSEFNYGYNQIKGIPIPLSGTFSYEGWRYDDWRRQFTSWYDIRQNIDGNFKRDGSSSGTVAWTDKWNTSNVYSPKSWTGTRKSDAGQFADKAGLYRQVVGADLRGHKLEMIVAADGQFFFKQSHPYKFFNEDTGGSGQLNSDGSFNQIWHKLPENREGARLTEGKARSLAINHINSNPDFIRPKSRKNEILSFAQDESGRSRAVPRASLRRKVASARLHTTLHTPTPSQVAVVHCGRSRVSLLV